MNITSIALALMLDATPPAAQSSPVFLSTSTGTIHGTQLIPKSRGGANRSQPVVLILAGSGPTDRNGNSLLLPGANNSLKMLAEGLADRGIASVRYDKRGVGESASAGSQEADLRFENYVDDAVVWIRKLQSDSRFSSVTVIGHSEGSLIGMLAAKKTRANGFVSIAGPARNAADLLRDQLRSQLPQDLFAESEKILNSLRRGKTVATISQQLQILYRPTVQPYLISWFRYTPSQEIKGLTMPVLITQGTTDIQVPVSEAKALKLAKPQGELVIIEGMNHVLKAVPLDPKQQTAAYSDPNLPVVPKLIESINNFVRSVKNPRSK
jgi:uncharacterized protein